MAAERLQFLLVFWSKDAIIQATSENVLLGYKKFGSVTRVVGYDNFWGMPFAMIQALYPIRHMKSGGMDKLKCYVCQTNHLLGDGLKNGMKKWVHPRMLSYHLMFIKSGEGFPETWRNMLCLNIVIFLQF